MVTVTRGFEFEAAHFLPNYDGKCKDLHGHSYKLEVSISGDIGFKSGMVMDFGFLKDIVNKNVIDKFDHKLLNDIFDLPTAENMVVWIKDTIKENLPKPIMEGVTSLEVVSVKLWETSNSYAEWRKE